MAGDDGGGLHDFVAGRYAELRRSAFLMCGDWALADELTQKSLARLVGESRRTKVDDPDAFVYSHLMASFQRRRSSGRQHLFVAAPRETPDAAPPPPREPPSDAAPPSVSEAVSDLTPPAAHQAEPSRSAAHQAERSAAHQAGTTPPAALEVETTPPAAQEVAAGNAGPSVRAEPRHGSGGVSAEEKPQTRKIADTGAVAGRDAQVGRGGRADGTAGALHGGQVDVGAGDPIRTILVLDALHKLAPRCRAVLVLRHWDGFAVDETADMLGLADERVDAYEAAGLAALDYLLAEKAR